MTLPFCGRGLSLRANVSFTALQAQFIGQILGQVTSLPVLEDKSHKEELQISYGQWIFSNFKANYNQEHSVAHEVNK